MRFLRATVALIGLLGLCGPAMAQLPKMPTGIPAPAPAPGPADLAAGLTAAQAQQVLDVLQNDARRTQFVTTLANMARALAATGVAPPPVSVAPISAAPVRIVPNSLGAQVLDRLSQELDSGAAEFSATVRTVGDYGLVLRWWTRLTTDPDAMAQVFDFGWKILVVAVVAGLAEWGVIRLLRRVRRTIDEVGADGRLPAHQHGPHQGHRHGHPPERADGPPPDADADIGDDSPHEPPEDAAPHPNAAAMLRRVPLVLLRLLLDLAPVGAFAAVATALLGTPLGSPPATKLMILAMINTYLVWRLLLCATRMMVSPKSPALRLVHMSDGGARFVVRWVRRIAGIVTCGYGATEVAVLLGLYPSAQEAIMKLVALVAHVMLVIVVLQSRAPVAKWLRARPDARGIVAILRNRLAASWHIVAIFYIVALWLVWALEVRDGFAKLLHFFIVTVAVLGLTRVISIVMLGGLDRAMRLDPDVATRYPGLEARASRYHPMVRAVLNTIIAIASLLALFQFWGLEPLAWFAEGGLGGRLVSAGMTMATTLLISLVVWESANAAIERRLAVLVRASEAPRAARLRTLMPILRTSLLITLWTIAGLMVLSEIGINIAPLLAGAGVIGVAVGFGSQKLVQDIITGLFLLLENTMQVGDTVALASLTGTIETLSVRTIRLRALDGSVHIIPFSAVTSVTNMTRDFSYAVIDIESGFNEEPDVISGILRDIAAEMRLEEDWRDALRDDLEVLGVEKFLENAWVLRVRIKTQPTKRWAVQREINRRVKYRFDRLAIESPFTSFRVLSQNPAPPAPQPDMPRVAPFQEAGAAPLPGPRLPIGQETPH